MLQTFKNPKNARRYCDTNVNLKMKKVIAVVNFETLILKGQSLPKEGQRENGQLYENMTIKITMNII